MRTITTIGVLQTLLGCDREGSVGQPGCPDLLSQAPSDGQVDAYWFDVIDVGLSQSAELARQSGGVTVRPLDTLSAVAGATEWHDAFRATYYPFEPWTIGSTYRAIVDSGETGCPELAWEFAVGDALSTKVPLESVVNKTWVMELLEGADFAFPAGNTAGLAGWLGAPPLAFSVVSSLQEGTHILTGAVQDGVQNACVETSNLLLDFGQSPYFFASADEVRLALFGVPSVRFEKVSLSGAFGADGATIGGFRLDGQARVDDVAVALGYAELDPCLLVGAIGLRCEPCPVTPEALCARLIIDDASVRMADSQQDFVEIRAVAEKCVLRLQ
jgi:hypothetical protein